MSAKDVPPGNLLLEMCGVARHFDVSAPWLNRVLERRGRASV